MNALDTSASASGAIDGLVTITARPGRSARTVFRLLENLRGGSLDVRLADGASFAFGDGVPVAAMQVHDERAFDEILARGDIGLADTYVDGRWDSPDLARLLTLFAENREPLSRAVYGSFFRLLGARLRHRFNANSRAGARRNIMAHYDLGNDFYREWLDPTMSYSSALFSADDSRSLAKAQEAKFRRILRRIGAHPGDRILEIGCGWGGFAEVAAR